MQMRHRVEWCGHFSGDEWKNFGGLYRLLCFSHFHQLSAPLRKRRTKSMAKQGFAFRPHQSTLTCTNTQTLFWSVLHKACHFDSDFNASREDALQTEKPGSTERKKEKKPRLYCSLTAFRIAQRLANKSIQIWENLDRSSVKLTHAWLYWIRAYSCLSVNTVNFTIHVKFSYESKEPRACSDRSFARRWN